MKHNFTPQSFSRVDQSHLNHWWWTIDHVNLMLTFVMIGVGIVLILAGSPAVAEEVGLPSNHFIMRHLTFLPIAIGIIMILSMATDRLVSLFGLCGLGAVIGLLVLVLMFGHEIKGATRWINIAGFSLQPSEFAKPFFIVASAWILCHWTFMSLFYRRLISALLFLVTAGLIIMQPDLGSTVLFAVMWGVQLFLNHISWIIVIILAIIGIIALAIAYLSFEHVRFRIHSFFADDVGDQYQISKSIEAFQHGRTFGVGPGEGQVKFHLPDSHSDFIFAVAGEEFGYIFCMMILILMGVFVLRGLWRMQHQQLDFHLLAGAPLIVGFGMQAAINIGSTLHLIPTKGMTLPLMSYGGSSLLAISVTTGLILYFTRKRGLLFRFNKDYEDEMDMALYDDKDDGSKKHPHPRTGPSDPFDDDF